MNKESLKKEYILRMLSKERLGVHESCRLIWFFQQEQGIKCSVEDIYFKYFTPDPDNSTQFILEHARQYFRRHYSIKPPRLIDEVDVGSLNHGDIVYDRGQRPWVWEGETFFPVRYFK